MAMTLPEQLLLILGIRCPDVTLVSCVVANNEFAEILNYSRS